MEEKLFNASMKFIRVCDAKLTEKEEEGWVGWDKKENEEEFEKRLTRHLLKDFTQESLIDISNYCMFLWNLKDIKKGGNQ